MTELKQGTNVPKSDNSSSKDELKFFFENEEDKLMGIETAISKNGNKIKKFLLSDGREAVVRELTGRDMKKIEVIAEGKQINAIPAMMYLATTINGSEVPMEDYDDMKARDYSKIKYAASSINFL